jgi:methylenetetrahydrofolate--tRNA-(uracil-5-)-methyltransferase
MIHIIGGGLAGCEAAWQAASRGVPVTIHEMRPARPTEVHKTDRLAELVCSNSFRGDKLDNAVGLLKEEMRRLDSLVMHAAEIARVPAGAALAVDRELFARTVTQAIHEHPLITLSREEITSIPAATDESPVIIATGPLTSPALSAAIVQLVGNEHLYFYDAISPIVLAETIDMSKVFRASRWNRNSPQSTVASRQSQVDSLKTCGIDDGAGDYLNCPMTADEYRAFYAALVSAESATVHDFDKEKFFEGCLPIEVMAHRGEDTLRFGPMKPVGLTDPRTGRQPYAAVQLRQDNLAGDHYSLVGFQTQLKWGEQARVLRMIPGLEQAEFVRFGMVHRNTYINGPTVLHETWQTRANPSLFFAGQISGVEGYVESAASGLIAGRNAAALVRGQALNVPPRTTAIGALAFYVSHANPHDYQPTNITFGIMEPPAGHIRDKQRRKLAISERALADLDEFRRRDAKTQSLYSENRSLRLGGSASGQKTGL